MKSHRAGRSVALPGVALILVLLLLPSLALGQAAAPARAEDEKPPLPTKKAAEEDPPLPSRKPAPARKPRVRVTAASAEVQSGDRVIATVRRGEELIFTRKTEDYYLVVVNGKKGWIKKEAVHEVEVPAGDAKNPIAEVPPGPAPAAIDKETAHKVKRATAYVRVRLADGNTVEGSGFFAVQPGLVFTNAHVLGMLRPGSARPAEVRVVVQSGEAEEFTLPAEVLGVDRANDLAVLRVKGRASRFPRALPVDTSRALSLVQKVYIFGFPFGTGLGKDITVSESSISSIRKDAAGAAVRIQVNGGMHRGNSGGPVVDSRGVVVGVAVSVIRGTQIHFAIPGEKVQELLVGHVTQTQLGEAFLDKDHVKLPVRLRCLDPLQHIRTVKLDVWTGKAAASRPPSATKPKPLPGDGSRQTLAVAYQDRAAQVDVVIPSLAAGQILWIQPVLTDSSGAMHWERATAYKPSELPPLERTTADLRMRFDRPPQRTVKMASSYTIQVLKGRKRMLWRDVMAVEMLETAQKEPRGGRFDLFLGVYKFTTSEMNGKPTPVSPRVQPLLRNRNMTFIVNPQGALVQRTVPILRAPFARVVREDFAELVHQIANAHEMTCLAFPNRRVAALATWKVRVPLILAYEGKKKIVDMLLTCTYEGSRGKGRDQYAVIRLSGYVKGREPGNKSSGGTVTGTVHFALADHFLSLANIKVQSESEDDDLALAYSLELTLTRVSGNSTGIVARPVAAVPGPPPGPGTDYERALPYLKKRDYDRAIPLLEKAIAANPRLVQAQIDLGFAYNQKRLYDKAIPCLKRAIELNPNQATVHNNLGAAYNGTGRYDDAIPHLKRAIELDPSNVVFHGNLGFAYNGTGLRDQAIACYKKVLELAPKHVGAHNRLGVVYLSKGLYEDAIASFKKVLELAPNDANGLNNLGMAYNAQGLHDQGIPLLKKAVEHYPKHLVAYDNLGAAFGEIGEFKQACDAYKHVLALIPKTAPQFASKKRALEGMETLLRLEHDLPDIVKGKRKPKDFQEGVQWGKICRMKHYYGAALRLYNQALASDPAAAGKLTPVNLVILAQTALLASAGKGIEPPPEADRPKYRAQALAWLQKFVKNQQEALEKNYNANRYGCQEGLRRLLHHKDLASIRAPALNSLAAGERKEWESFWNEVETLLEKADALPSEPAAGQNP